MSVSATSPTTAQAAASQTTTASKANAADGGLGQDAFLSLLTTELQHQDPTEPMDNAAFITQLATFNSLSQLTSINASTAAMQQSLAHLDTVFNAVASAASNRATADGTQTTGITGGNQ